MNTFLHILYLMFLLQCVLGSLPAPVNVSVISYDLNHILRWDPGPGSPPGTHYIIYKSVKGKLKPPKNSAKTSVKLKIHNDDSYRLYVQASYNQTRSPNSSKITFVGFEQSIIRPPKLSVAGCGNCIQINISMPEKVLSFYNVFFDVWWKHRNESVNVFQTRNMTVTLNNLKTGEEYCVQVHTKMVGNKRSQPSAWTCVFTSIVEPRKVDIIVGAVSVLLILAIIGLMSFLHCLFYTGFLCKLKTTLPGGLKNLNPGKILSLDRTIPDLISVSTETDKQNKCKNPTMPRPATGSGQEEDDEEEEDEEENAYMNRGVGLSSGESSCQESRDVSGNNAVAAVEEADAEFDQHEAKDEGAEASFMPGGVQTEVRGHVTGEEEDEEKEDVMEKEEVCHSSGNINLFSVTLAVLAAGEEEEEEEEEEQKTRDSFIDFLKLSDLEPLLSTDSQTESDNQITLMRGVNETGYEGRCANTLSTYLKASDSETQEEEEEEEEESSGYMGRT